MKVVINCLGLVFDIVGAVILFKFGLPEEISRSGAISLVIEGTDQDEVKKGRLYDRWGRIGLILLILGFIFQFASNFIE